MKRKMKQSKLLDMCVFPQFYCVVYVSFLDRSQAARTLQYVKFHSHSHGSPGRQTRGLANKSKHTLILHYVDYYDYVDYLYIVYCAFLTDDDVDDKGAIMMMTDIISGRLFDYIL